MKYNNWLIYSLIDMDFSDSGTQMFTSFFGSFSFDD